MQNAKCKMQIANWKMQRGKKGAGREKQEGWKDGMVEEWGEPEFKMQNAKCKLQIGKCKGERRVKGGKSRKDGMVEGWVRTVQVEK
jgi:hypothetical protein